MAEEEPAEDSDVISELTRAHAWVEPATIKNQSPKKVITAALAAGFEMKAYDSEWHEQGAPFKSGARIGQRPKAKDITRLVVGAKLGKVARFEARFNSGSFDHAFVWDAAGWPTELYHDYTPTSDAVKQVKDEPEWAWRARADRVQQAARQQDWSYNDGESFVNMAPRLVKAFGEFEEWFHDIVPSYQPRQTKKKEPEAPATAEALIEMGEWHG